MIGELVQYKTVHIAIEAFTKSGRALVIIGGGEKERHLHASMESSIRFAGRLNDTTMRRLYGAKSFNFPWRGKFGIVPIEAMAAGKHVIAYGRGGALETIRLGLASLF